MIVFSIAEKDALEHALDRYVEVSQLRGPDWPIILVGTHTDISQDDWFYTKR